jgi:hypothetical protein
METSEIQHILDQAQLAREIPTHFEKEYKRMLKRQLHELAEAQCLMAQDFFLSCISDLSDENANWRLDGLTNLGFHYQFSPDSEICEKVRFLLLNDSDDMIRHSAATVLGGRSKWLDSALVSALSSDPDESVRASAFIALLALAGVPFLRCCQEEVRVDQGELQPTFEEIRRIASEYGIDIDNLTS